MITAKMMQQPEEKSGPLRIGCILHRNCNITSGNKKAITVIENVRGGGNAVKVRLRVFF